MSLIENLSNIISNYWRKGLGEKLIIILLGIILWPLILIYLTLKQKWDAKYKLASVVMVLVLWVMSTRFIILNQGSTATIPTPSPASSQQGDCVGPDGKRIQLDPINCQRFNDAWKNSQKPQQQSQQSIVSPTPTSIPIPTATPVATPKVDSKSSQAKQVRASVFKKFFVDHFNYQQFTKSFGTSDKWEFWESFDPDGNHLIVGVTGDDLKSGILKASPNEISSIQIVSFFQMGYPPLVSSGWVENAVSDLKLGDTKETVIDNVSAKITLTYANIWIVSFIEE